jgi:hypothetical protein
MRITSAGNVGIGTTSPGNFTGLSFSEPILDVAGILQSRTGNIALGGTSYRKAALMTSTGTDAPYLDLRVGDSGTSSSTTTRMRIDSAGNVGIGITNPAAKLEVNGNIKANGSVSVTNIVTNKVVKFNGSILDDSSIYDNGNVGIGTNNPAERLHITDSDDVNIYLESTDTTVTAGQSYGGLIWKSNDGSGIGARDTGRIQLVSSGSVAESDMLFFTTDYNVAMSEKMRITSTGNVGIGTTSPDHKLRVNGDARIGNLHIKTADFGTQGTGKTIYADAAGGGVLGFTSTTAFDFSNGITSRMRITSGGNVGIGTTNPQAKLEVASGDLIINNSGGKIDFRDGSGSSRYFLELANSNADLQINDRTGAGSVSMTIQSGGNVGIGTTSPGAQLHIGSPEATPGGTAGTVDRFIVQPYSNTGGPYIFKARTVSGSEDYLDLYYGSNQIISYGLNGNVGIGTTSPDYKLDVEGSVNGDVDARIYNSFDDNNASSTPKAALRLEAASNNGYFRVYGAPADTVSKHQVDLGSTAGGSFLTFTLGVTERMRITNSGNIGIGTTNPSEKLSIATSTNASAEVGYAHVGHIGHNTYAGFSHVNQNTTVSYALLQASSGETYINAPTGQNINFRINNSTHMVLNNGGNIGIGTTSPSQKLDVVGSAKVSGQTHTGTLRVDATAAGPNPVPNQSPSDAIVRPAGDTAIYLSEPDEWLEININGTNYVIPAYEA